MPSLALQNGEKPEFKMETVRGTEKSTYRTDKSIPFREKIGIFLGLGERAPARA